MKTSQFCEEYNPCREGRKYAMAFGHMSEVWQNCTNPDWLLWILERHRPLTKTEAVTLAIAFAEGAMKMAPPATDTRPQEAVAAAKAWLDNPNGETARAARVASAAADSAADATWAARAAAAAWAAWAAWAAGSAAAAADAARAAGAAWSARVAWAAGAESAWEAAEAAQCRDIRDAIPNPFAGPPPPKATPPHPPAPRKGAGKINEKH